MVLQRRASCDPTRHSAFRFMVFHSRRAHTHGFSFDDRALTTRCQPMRFAHTGEKSARSLTHTRHSVYSCVGTKVVHVEPRELT